MMTHEDWDFIAKQNQEFSALAESGDLTQLALVLPNCDWQLPLMCDFEYYAEHCRHEWGPSEEDQETICSWILDTACVLDIGFGYGHVLRRLARKFGDACASLTLLHGADSSETAGLLLQKELPEVELVHADVTVGLPWGDGFFDIVVFMEVLEHLSPAQGQKALVEVRRVLADDGRMVFSTRINENLSRSLLRCPSCQLVQHPAGHVRSFSETLLRAELKIAGFWLSDTMRSPGGILARCAKLS